MKKTNCCRCVHTVQQKSCIYMCIFCESDLFIIPKRCFFVFDNGVFFHLCVMWPTKTILFWTKHIFCFFVCSKKYSFYIPNCIWNKYHVETQFVKVSKNNTKKGSLCAVVCLVMIASEVAFLMWLIPVSTAIR